ncbi:MAG: S-layer homology domain-containing protein [Clostridia bacterium]|nr:S-layer homology domain-containing protein [Clostridia bacterium]
MFRKLRITGLNKFKNIVAAVLAAMMLAISVPFAASAASAFADLNSKEWYYDAVITSINEGYFKGDADGNFYPNNNITRAEFAMIVTRYCGVDANSAVGAPFADVPKEEWFYGAVSWAYNKGIINGVSTTEFKPQDPITREQMCKMIGIALENVLGKKLSADGAKTFLDDAKISGWAKEWVNKCSAEGLITGLDTGCFDPSGQATRAQAATVLIRCDTYFPSTPTEQVPGDPKDYSIQVSGFSLNFDVNDDYYLAYPSDFSNCKITGYTGFTALGVQVEQYAGHYPYLNEAYKMGDALDLGYGRTKVTLTGTLADGSTKEYLLVFTDPEALDNSYAKVTVSSSVNLRKTPSVTASVLTKLDGGTTVYYLGTEGDWAKVQYVKSIYSGGALSKTNSYVGYVKDTAEENYIRWNWEEVEMPAQYEEEINALKAKHPNWTFTFVDPELTFEETVQKYGASREQYIDPLFYLNEDKIFAFLDIDTYDPEGWTDEGIKNIWVNETAIKKEEALSYFKNASSSLLMNPYYIACRAALESGYGTSPYSKGMNSVSKVTDRDTGIYHETFDLGGTYYNFYGIGAYDSNPRYCMIYAMRRNWSTKETAIIEGANWIKDQYLDRGAVTPYFFRYSGFWNKSYMTDAQAPAKEAGILKKAFSDPNAKAHFIIPVYRGMT